MYCRFLLISLSCFLCSLAHGDVLEDALQKIGSPKMSIQAPSTTTLTAFLYYANNSSKPLYNSLTREERKALIQEILYLQKQELFPESLVHKVCTAEKLRLGMSPLEIQTLQTLLDKKASLSPEEENPLSLFEETRVQELLSLMQSNIELFSPDLISLFTDYL